MFIQTENTPNPNSIKFFPGVEFSIKQPVFFSNLTEVKGKSRLAELLFKINEVRSVFFSNDFITITKKDEANWQTLKPEILMIIMDYFVAGFPIFEENNLANNSNDLKNLSEIENQIIEIIETRVRPSVAQDGGDIIYKSFENGIVKLELHGSCAGCPSSTITLKNGIESMLKHYIPEVESVEAVDEEEF